MVDMNIDFTKEYLKPINENSRALRLAESSPWNCGDGVFVEDRLEKDGIIKIYEYIGGTVILPINADEMEHIKNLTCIAGVSVFSSDESTIQVDKISCEFGQEEYIHKLLRRIYEFAVFYNRKFCILDLKK